MKALLSIDYTWDFVATKGALTTAEEVKKLKQPLFKLRKNLLKPVISSFLPLIDMKKKMRSILKTSYFLRII